MSKILMNYSDYGHLPERLEKNEYGGLGYYRIIKPSQLIKGHEVTVIGKEIRDFGEDLVSQWDEVFSKYDIYWTNYFVNDKAGAAMLFNAQKHGKKVILDVDDNYLDIPESNKLYERFKRGTRERAMMSTILSFADIIVTSTFPLKERLNDHFQNIYNLKKNIIVIPNLNDIRDWNYKPIEKTGDKLVIGYTGSNSHNDDLKMILPAMKNIMTKYPHVWFELLGVLDKTNAPVMFKNWPSSLLDRVALIGCTATFKEYPEWLSQRQWDIGLAPLVDTIFTRCKSSIKWIEYSMFKIPVIASRVYPYFVDLGGRRTIEDGKTGLLSRVGDWESNLEKLILDKDTRMMLGENAYKYIKDNWQYKDSNISGIIDNAIKGVV